MASKKDTNTEVVMPMKEFGDDCEYCGCYFVSEIDLRRHIDASHRKEKLAKSEI